MYAKYCYTLNPLLGTDYRHCNTKKKNGYRSILLSNNDKTRPTLTFLMIVFNDTLKFIICGPSYLELFI